MLKKMKPKTNPDCAIKLTFEGSGNLQISKRERKGWAYPESAIFGVVILRSVTRQVLVTCRCGRSVDDQVHLNFLKNTLSMGKSLDFVPKSDPHTMKDFSVC